MPTDFQSLANTYGDRIRKGKHSYQRIASMCSITLDDAKTLAAIVRPPNRKRAPEVSDFVEDRYYYNEQTQTYVFSPTSGEFTASKPMIDGLVRAYSNMAGKPATLEQLTRTFPFTRSQITFMLRAMKVTHDSPPFTEEDLQTKTDDEILKAIDFSIERRQRLIRSVEQSKWDAVKRDAQNWVEFETRTLQAILNAVANRPEQLETPEPVTTKPSRFAAVIGLSDFHWGKYSDPKENFEGFNRQTASKRLVAATQEIQQFFDRYGNPERIYVPIGSDFFHIDTSKGTTTDGTPQDADGTFAEIVETGLQLMESWINTLAQQGNVELVLMSGNHDRTTGFALLLALEGIFRGRSDIKVNRARTPRNYVTYGRNLIGFVHGDAVKRTEEIAILMAQEAAYAWASCPHRTVYTGHLHNERTETDTAGSIVRRQLPSLAGTDRWHALNGYVGAPKSLPVYLHDKDSGLFNVFYAKGA